jgi:hypothetical protein
MSPGKQKKAEESAPKLHARVGRGMNNAKRYGKQMLCAEGEKKREHDRFDDRAKQLLIPLSRRTLLEREL